MGTMIGIYKITSPSGKVYIGQSWHIERRWKTYRISQCKSQPAIYKSLVKYGHKAHKFQIINELPIDVSQSTINQLEEAYIEIYRSAGIKMLNMMSGGAPGKPNEEVLVKLRKPKSAEHRKNISLAVKKQWDQGIKKPFTHHTEESKRKTSATKMGHRNWRKFTLQQANDIRRKYKEGHTRRMLSKEYDCYKGTITDITNNRIYND
jgi:group I intron endonuclease